MRLSSLLLVLLLLLPVPISAQEPTPCPMTEWYTHYGNLMDSAFQSLPTGEDEGEILIQKTITLYQIQFYLEVLGKESPDCAVGVLSNAAYLISLWADFGMLLIIQSGEGALPDAAFTLLMDRFTTAINGSVENLESSQTQLALFEQAQ